MKSSDNLKLVVHVIAGLNDGGAEAVLYRLCINCVGIRHHVISMMGDGKYGPLLREAGVSVTCLNMPQGRVTFSGLWRLWRLLCIERPSVMQTWMYHADLVGGVLARFAGVKRVFWNIRHTTLDSVHSKRSTIVVARLCALLSRWLPTRIVCCAQKAVEVHRALGYSPRKMLVIPNGYDLSRFIPDFEARTHLRSEWGVGDRWLLGMVGRFDPQKDHRNFISALALLKKRGTDFCAVLIGRGLDDGNQELLGWLQDLELTGDVFFLGQRNDIPDVMNALDVHVLSSAFGEAFPNVVAEAMACGKPAISTDVGDADMIIGNTGWVVMPRSAPALADALSFARVEMDDAKKWAARCASARQRVEDNFSLSRMVASYDTLWRNGRL